MNHIKNGVFLCATSKKLNKHLIKDIKGKPEREGDGERGRRGQKKLARKAFTFCGHSQAGRK